MHCCRAFLLSWNSNFLTFLGFIQLSSKRNQAPWDGGQIPYFHYKGSSIKIKGSYQKFYKRGSSTKRRGFTWREGSLFCFGGYFLIKKHRLNATQNYVATTCQIWYLCRIKLCKIQKTFLCLMRLSHKSKKPQIVVTIVPRRYQKLRTAVTNK